MKIRKGSLVRLKQDLVHQLSHQRDGSFIASRPTTHREREEWRDNLNAEIAAAAPEDRFSIACDSAGESRLAPRSVQVFFPTEGLFIVERARCRVSLGWGNPTGGMTKILYPATGESGYVAREFLEVVCEE